MQRLGHLLELIEHEELARTLVDHVREHATVVTPLVRSRSAARAPRAKRWKLAINADWDVDRAGEVVMKHLLSRLFG